MCGFNLGQSRCPVRSRHVTLCPSVFVYCCECSSFLILSFFTDILKDFSIIAFYVPGIKKAFASILVNVWKEIAGIENYCKFSIRPNKVVVKAQGHCDFVLVCYINLRNTLRGFLQIWHKCPLRF